MNIVLTSYSFAPAIGGIETASLSLGHEFTQAGHDVTIVTATPGPDEVEGLRVVRRPGPWQLLRLMRRADAVLQFNISLRFLWPCLLLRTPAVVCLATWLRRPDGRVAWQDRLKHLVLKRVRVVTISRAVAESISEPSDVVHISYRSDIFIEHADVERDRDLVFLGRLVSDKGADVLLRALGLLRDRDIKPTLSIIGTGPEAEPLAALATELGVDRQVDFLGSLQGVELCRALNRHQVMVVPSTWEEPFGIVALEGIASGCVLVVSDRGGLPEAAGPCGLTFPNGDAARLAEQLEEAMDPRVREGLRAHAGAHLLANSPQVEARRYLELLGDERARMNGAPQHAV